LLLLLLFHYLDLTKSGINAFLQVHPGKNGVQREKLDYRDYRLPTKVNKAIRVTQVKWASKASLVLGVNLVKQVPLGLLENQQQERVSI